MHRPNPLLGALVGLLAGAAISGIFWFAFHLLGLAFVPFDIFDAMARVLPGPVITFGIDTMVNMLILLNFDVAETAKTAEHLMAVGAFLATLTVAGGLLFLVFGRTEQEQESSNTGLLVGAVMGVALALITINFNVGSTAPVFLSAAWILAGVTAWGFTVERSYRALSVPATESEGAKEAETGEEVSTEGIKVGEDLTLVQQSRRRFLLTMGGTSAAISLVGAGLGAIAANRREAAIAEQIAASAESGPDEVDGESEGEFDADALRQEAIELPNANASVEPVPGTRLEYTPLEDHYRIDISTVPPTIIGSNWVLPITGLVANPLELTLNDLKTRYEPREEFVTLACISNRIAGNLISTILWTGASLREILADAGPLESARYLIIHSADGFHETVDLELINLDERIMLAYFWDRQPLPRRNGFPLRIWIPNRYGMKQPKWITEMEVVAEYEPGYWVARNWDEDAFMRATSVIDTVEQIDDETVGIGGIAHAGDRSISQVQVRIDGGEWQDAELRDPLSNATWVIWRYEWTFEAGSHSFEVRCVEGDGTPQIEAVASPRPSGATGIHRVTETL
ncbi:MAG: molybdopterin-dependent oxidoreductase [Chloroflexi bacterium]|nr:molybdopterin-dependent oxidoreductase [Chloroflexota bacterium]